MPVSEQTFQALALEDPEGQWELHCGRPRQKPGMSFEHNHVERYLTRDLNRQLDPDVYEVSDNSARLRVSEEHYYIPDRCVIPVDLARLHRGSRALEVYADPVPLVVEVWSPSTGSYDVETKLANYQRRGDPEIWRIHPYERNLTIWRREPDGSYVESRHVSGTIHPIALPGVAIDLDALFA